MKIKVRPDLCCAVGLCAMTAPNVYQLGEDGYNKMDGRDVPPGHEEEARIGASACPETAISLIEDDS